MLVLRSTGMNAEVVNTALEVWDIWAYLLLVNMIIVITMTLTKKFYGKIRYLIVDLLCEKANKHPEACLQLLRHGQHIGAQGGEVLLHRSASHLNDVLR